MNRKQKVLTVIALIAFVGIGACHYLAWPPLLLYESRYVSHTAWKELTYDEARQEFPNGYFPELANVNEPSPIFGEDVKMIFLHRLQEQGGYTDSNGQYQTYIKDHSYRSLPAGGFGFDILVTMIPVDAKLWFKLHPGNYEAFWNPRLNTNASDVLVPDLRIPWFMLGVIYAGLFFLLADKKEKR